MKINYIIVLLFFILSGKAQSPQFKWAKEIGASFAEFAFGVKSDNQGHVYFTGQFSTVVDFDPGIGSYTLASVGSVDAYLAKFDTSGNFIWVRSWGGWTQDLGAEVTIDPFGNILICGYFQGTVDFDPGPAVFNISSNGQSDSFIIKLDPSGNFIWAITFGANLTDSPYRVATDQTGNVYCSGYFQGVTDFDPSAGTYTLQSQGSYDCFVVKYNTLGNLIWARGFGSPETDQLYGMAVDNLGNSYLTGYYLDTADFDPGPATYTVASTSQYDKDLYLLKLDSNGLFNWVNTINGVSDDFGIAVITNSIGDVFLAGSFLGMRDFDPSPSTYTIVSNGWADVFIEKFDNSGNMIWTKAYGGVNSESLNNFSLSNDGSMLLTGSFDASVDFDPGPGTFSLTSIGINKDAYLLKLNNQGLFQWAGSFGGSAGDYGNAVYVDSNNDIFLVGSIGGVADLDPSVNTFTLGAAFNTQAYIVRFRDCVAPSSPTNATPPTNQTVCASSTTTLMVTSTGSVNWYNSPTSTLTIGTGTNFVTSTLTAGTYTFYAEAVTCQPSATRTPITLLVSPCTGINQQSNFLSNISVYPNPSSGIFNIMNLPSGKTELKVLNVLGQQIINKETDGNTFLDLTALSNGIYFIRVKTSSNHISTFKVVKE